MIAQIQGLQAFVANQLGDIIDWSKHVRPDPEFKTTGDHAQVEIKTPFNRYTMSIRSSYIEPPPGAPLPCRSLGTVTLDDAAADKHIVGPKSDNTWTEISKHIHTRELTDALAVARRESAEAPKELAGQARVRLADVAAKAKKWGVAVRPGEESGMMPPLDVKIIPDGSSEAQAATAAALTEPFHGAVVINSSTADDTASASSPRPGAPWLGCPVIFVTNPGEQISGMQEIPGQCVKVLSDDRISVFMTPDHSEPSYKDNLPRRGSPAGNGKVHQFNCWDFNPEFERERSRLRHCEEAIEKMADEGNAQAQTMAELVEANKRLLVRLDAIEEAAKPKSAKKTRENELV